MYEVNLYDTTTNKEFKKIFTNEYLTRKFLNKIKYSKKLKLISYWRIA